MIGPESETDAKIVPRLSERKAIVGVVGLLLLGAFLRLSHLLGQRAFWLDEFFVLDNLMNRGYAELQEPLASDQVAPYGVLVVMKWFGETFGFTELGVRLPALLVSLVSLVLFYLVARRLSSSLTLLVAALLFATNAGLIYYAAELKQYAFDAAAVLLVFFLTLPLLTEWRVSRLVALGVAGVIVVWFSHPVAFALAAAGTVLIFRQVADRRFERAGVVTLISAFWLVSFVLQLVLVAPVSEEALSNQQDLYWSSFFMPTPPTSINEILWFWRALTGLFSWPLGFEATALAAVTAMIGAWSMAQRSRSAVWLLLLPVFIALLASGARLYPFTGRLLLFAAPTILLLMAEGVALFASWAWPRSRLVCVLGIVVLMFHALAVPLREGLKRQPYLREPVPDVLAFVARNAESDDRIVLNASAVSAFRHYAPDYGLEDLPQTVVYESDADQSGYSSSLQPLACGPRVWLVFSHVANRRLDPEALMVQEAERLGTQLASVAPNYASMWGRYSRATAHLYDFAKQDCK